MADPLHLNRRSVLKGSLLDDLALPVLEAMGREVSQKIPRRFCALYTANGMSLPKAEHEIQDWHWFPQETGRSSSLVNQQSLWLPIAINSVFWEVSIIQMESKSTDIPVRYVVDRCPFTQS
ncbi:MAG: hypothetical protein R3C11_06725 [Planctomycetaceae bacterium]